MYERKQLQEGIIDAVEQKDVVNSGVRGTKHEGQGPQDRGGLTTSTPKAMAVFDGPGIA
jgi:hypothetical protein